MVDVIITFLFVKWLMLMLLVADGMPLKFMWLMLLPLAFVGRCCCQNCVMWQMLLLLGRCYSQWGGGLADVIANMTDVIAKGFVFILI